VERCLVDPFRVFTSLLRLELIEDEGLRGEAEAILAKRRIYTPRAVALIERHEQNGGLTEAEATELVAEALETFRWHGEATVSADTYKRL
ncbi:2-oxoadipate dioxygenase/decarboxylase family protein, partial [Rhizobium ruizarguesonis]